jgi:nitric oxide reductase subunit C
MYKKNYLLLPLIITFGVLLAACGGTGDGGGDAAAGEELFSMSIIGSQPGCITCHSLEPGTVVVGPSMAGIASRAGSQVSGLSAEDYIRQSILEPDAYVVEGFDPGVMVQVWEDELTDEQIDSLISYLLTLQ